MHDLFKSNTHTHTQTVVFLNFLFDFELSMWWSVCVVQNTNITTLSFLVSLLLVLRINGIFQLEFIFVGQSGIHIFQFMPLGEEYRVNIPFEFMWSFILDFIFFFIHHRKNIFALCLQKIL